MKFFRRHPARVMFYGIALLAAFLCFAADKPVGEWIAGGGADSLRDFMGVVSHYGDWPWLMAGGVVLLGVGWRLGSRWREMIVAAMIASTVAGLAVNTLRLTTGRTRPSNTEAEQGWYGPEKIGRYKFNSFPSGHTATAAGAGLVLVFYGLKPGIVGLAFTLLMVMSRISVGAHHPSDAAFAVVIAAGAADWVYHSFLPWLRRRVRWLRHGPDVTA